MRKSSYLVIFLVFSFLVAGCNVSNESYLVQRKFKQDYHQDMRLDIETSSGDIKINNWDRDYIQVKALITGYADTKNRAMEIAEGTEINFTYYQQNLKIRKQNKGENVSVDYQLKVPRECRGRLDTSSGDVKIAELTGDLLIETSSGDIKLAELMGDLQSDTSSGDVELGEIEGDFDHESSSGDVEIDYLQGQANIKISSGDIEGTFELADRNNKIEVSSGEVKLKLAGQPSLELRLTTSSGEINISGLKLKASTVSEETVTGLIGQGAGQLEIDSSSGDITLLKAD